MPEQPKSFIRTVVTHTIAAVVGAALAEWLAGRRHDAILSADSEIEKAHSDVDDIETSMLLLCGFLAALYAEDDPPSVFSVESTEEAINGLKRSIPPSVTSRVLYQRVPVIVNRIRSGINTPWTLIPRSASARVLEACTGFMDQLQQRKRQSNEPISDGDKLEGVEKLGTLLEKWRREKRPTPAIYLHLMSAIRA